MEPGRDDRDRPLSLESQLGSERGATAVEYGLLVALIAALVIVAVEGLGNTVNGLFQSVQWW